jgi:AcrR family transcriptional regulator
MARRPATDPRKAASQGRSRATVEALVEATARILVRDGFDRASTNRIAVEAGVSVGSLYQYFPGKEALVAAVIARHSRDLMAVTRAAMDSAAAEPLEIGVRNMIAAAVEAHRLDPALHRVLAEQTPHTGALLADVDVFGHDPYGLFRAWLEARGAEVTAPDLDLAAFVCVTAIEALTHTAVLHRPEMLSDTAAGALVDEATRMVLGYLR